jgi:hypothetical protein
MRCRSKMPVIQDRYRNLPFPIGGFSHKRTLNIAAYLSLCDVPMWLVEVARSSEHEGHQIFECKVRDAKLLIPVTDAP